MFGKHIVKHLSAYHHRELTADHARRIDAHLRECASCRAAYEEIKFGAHLASFVKRVQAPDFPVSEPIAAPAAGRGARLKGLTPLLASLALVISLSVFLWNTIPAQPTAWNVVHTDGTGQQRTGRLPVGGSLSTDASSEARVRMADIGQLTLEPNTRIRLLESKPNEHRLALDRGRLDAFAVAPPRVFFIETPSAVAVDLGCAYTLQVDDDGSSLLHVTLGQVAMELNGRESYVPRDAFCRSRAGFGPGTPYFDDSTAALQSALNLMDFGPAGDRVSLLDTVLRESRPRDTLTLWHLIPRFDQTQRGRIYDRMAELVPPPAIVTRDGVLGLNLEMLDAWRVKMEFEVWWK
jgi:ferric-dicitrate binding protein FerR (iron transport regulator)